MEVAHGLITRRDGKRGLVFVRDISRRRAYTESLEHRALHDDLTGLANRTLFEEHMLRAIAIPEHGESPAVLLRRADAAMYVAKRSGNGHAVFDGQHEVQATRKLALLSDLRQCISRDELVLHYQPRIDLATRQVAGVEALVRWQHPDRGLLMPGTFSATSSAPR